MQTARAIYISLFFFITVASSCMATAYAFCFEKAGRYYNISPVLLAAISSVESNYNPNAINYNTNGSIDYCHMQINSWWGKSLSFRWQYLSDPCYCTMVGGWILRQCIDRYGYTWDAVACYHTGKSPAELKDRKKQRAVNYIRKIQHAIIHIK